MNFTFTSSPNFFYVLLKRLSLFILLFLVYALNINAQVSNYTFSQSNGTYSSISGTVVHASGWDEAVSAAITIPGFTFNGVAYTSCRISTNGFITFGTTAPSGSYYTPISGTTGYAGAVSAFGRDLISNASTIVYTTLGTAPNRTFVVQWNNARRYSGGAVAGDVLNFQIRLNEAGGVAANQTVVIMYGTNSATSTLNTIKGEVGLRGASNADFSNRLGGNNTAWNATTAGTFNDDAVNFKSTVVPASGLTFTWTPGAPVPPPSNDGCAAAIALNVNSGCITTSGTTTGATQTAAPATCSGAASTTANDVFYSFVANNTAQTVTVNSSVDMIVQAFSGSCASATTLGCTDETASGNEVLSLTGLTIGTTYFVRVYGYNAAFGTFTICVTGTCLSPTIYTVTGGGTYCSGGTAPSVGLSNSQNGFSYQLRLNGSNTGSPVNGTGAAITFGAQSAAGAYTVVATNRGISGCSATMTGSATVTVNTASSFTACPGNISTTTAPGLCTATVTYTATATGTPAPGVTYSFLGATTGSGNGTGSGATFNKGVTAVTITASNSCSPNATCSFNITVTDNQNPVINCPSNIIANTASGLCTAVVNFAATASDNCPGVGITYSQNPGTSFPKGTTTVTATATDASGNIATCMFNVTVNDTQNPVIVNLPANITQSNDAGLCSAVVTWTAPTASDNCAGSSIAQITGPANGSAFPTGVTTISYSATDAANNTVTQSFTVTVNDTENPVIVNLPANITQSNDAGLCSAVVTWTAPTASDNCAGSSIQQIAGPASGSAFPAGVTTISYRATDAANNTVTQSFTVTVNDTENPVASCPADQTFCEVSGNTYTIPTFSTSDNCGIGTITYNITGATIRNGTGNDASGVFATGTSTIIWTATDVNNNTSNCSTIVNIRAVLATPGPISGPVDACPLIGSATPTTYSVNTVAGAETYTWTVPAGVTLVSGQGTTAIQVTFDNSFALSNSFFTVIAASSSACSSLPDSLEVEKFVPGIPLSISGPTNVCPFAGQSTNATYTIANVPNATSYTWVVTSGGTIVNGQGTTSVEVSFSNSFTYGNIKVTANSNCGSRAPRSLSISKLVPAAPVSISGLTNACPFVGTGNQVTYSINPVANATSYTWTVPANVNLISGQGSTSINVTFNAGYTTSLFKVKSVAVCASSGDRSLSVTASAYGAPGTITGPVNACPFIGTNVEAVYTIRKVPNAPSYNWMVPAGVTISSHPGGAGVNDTIIKVTFDNNFVSGTSISVQTTGCFTSAASSLVITRTASSAMPGPITGPVNACEYMMSSSNPGGLPATYRIRKVSGATSYTWTAPSGATITSHPAGAGVNDTIVEVTFSSSFTTGNLAVSSSNGCGMSGARLLATKILNPAAPGAIDIMQTAPCPNREYTYSLAGYPTNTTSIQWTVPQGSVILSGQGTLSITVSYPSAAIQGALTATSYNNCSNSNTRSISIKLPACPSGFTGKGVEFTDAKKVITADLPVVNIFPNPTVSDFKLQVTSAGKEKISVKLFDLQGRLFKSATIVSGQIIAAGNDLKSGTYLIEIIQGEYKITKQLIKF